jgi:hypothetical protein
VLRGTAGGSSRIDNVYVGYKAGGDNFGNGGFDTSAGSIDVRANNFAIGTYIVNASNAQTGTFTMASGTVDATTLALGVLSSGSTGTPSISSVFNQNGGLVKASTVVFGSNGATIGSNSPTFASTYNLAGGTFAAASIVKLSDEDAEALYPGVPAARVLETIAARGSQIVVMTRGGEGALALGPSGLVEVAPLVVDVADTIGAGDALMASLITSLVDDPGLLAGDADALPRALRRAVVTAGITVSRPGANPPTRAEVDAAV